MDGIQKGPKRPKPATGGQPGDDPRPTTGTKDEHFRRNGWEYVILSEQARFEPRFYSLGVRTPAMTAAGGIMETLTGDRKDRAIAPIRDPGTGDRRSVLRCIGRHMDYVDDELARS